MENLYFFNGLNKMRESLLVYMIMWQLFLHKTFSFNSCNPTGIANRNKYAVVWCPLKLFFRYKVSSYWPVETCSCYLFSPFDIYSFVYVIRNDDFCLKHMLLHIHAACDDIQEKDTLDVLTKTPDCQNQVSSQQPSRWLLGSVFVFSLPH